MVKRLFWVIIALVVFGMVVLSSASTVQATKQFGSASYYWRHQLFFGVLPGLFLMWLFWKHVNYRRWRPLAFPLLFVALTLLVLVFIPHVGLRLNGATSWLDIGGYTFQPVEFLKFALVVYLAAWLAGSRDRVHNWRTGLVPFAVVMGGVSLLLLLQPDLGTLALVLIMAGGVYVAAGAPLKQAVLIACAAAVLVVGFAASSPHRWARLTTLVNPAADVRGAGWQVNQSLIAIGSGGLWGVGYGQSTQVFGFLPEPMGDSIFAVLVEELGLIGGVATLALFGFLAFTLVQVARAAPDTFGSLLVVGVLLWVMAQATVNMAAISGIGPLTGIPLPFISYGGTATMTLLAALGITLNVAEHA